MVFGTRPVSRVDLEPLCLVAPDPGRPPWWKSTPFSNVQEVRRHPYPVEEDLRVLEWGG